MISLRHKVQWYFLCKDWQVCCVVNNVVEGIVPLTKWLYLTQLCACLLLFIFFSKLHTRMHARTHPHPPTHTHTHARTHTRTHTHTHTPPPPLYSPQWYRPHIILPYSSFRWGLSDKISCALLVPAFGKADHRKDIVVPSKPCCYASALHG